MYIILKEKDLYSTITFKIYYYIGNVKMEEEIRIMIEEAEQKDLFGKFLKKFHNNFSTASNYLGITKSSLSKYKRGIVRYIPKEVLTMIVDYLEIENPKILFSGTLRQIRHDYMMKAHPVLKQKYGKNWAKELTNRRDFEILRLRNKIIKNNNLKISKSQSLAFHLLSFAIYQNKRHRRLQMH